MAPRLAGHPAAALHRGVDAALEVLAFEARVSAVAGRARRRAGS